MVEICQSQLPYRPWEEERTRRLPGLNPVAAGEWLLRDDAYAAQMAHRRALLDHKRDDVLRLDPMARRAADELLALLLEEIAGDPGYLIDRGRVTCPDGHVVEVTPDAPLATIGALVQEDMVIMQKQDDEHLLTGAVLCFPASWSLAQKFMRPMTRIHAPVHVYTADIAKRVQRLFDGIRVDRPIWRANYLVYGDPELHQPRTEEDRRDVYQDGPKWLRVERQTMRRLPISDAVIFSIHTYVLSEAQLDALGIEIPPPSGH